MSVKYAEKNCFQRFMNKNEMSWRIPARRSLKPTRFHQLFSEICKIGFPSTNFTDLKIPEYCWLFIMINVL